MENYRIRSENPPRIVPELFIVTASTHRVLVVAEMPDEPVGRRAEPTAVHAYALALLDLASLIPGRMKQCPFTSPSLRHRAGACQSVFRGGISMRQHFESSDGSWVPDACGLSCMP